MGLARELQIAREAIAGSERLLPDYVLDRVEDLDPQEIIDLGFRYLVFDFDNTLAHWGALSLPASSIRLFRRLLDKGLGVAVASNGHTRRFRKLSRQWETEDVAFLGRCGKPDSAKLEAFLKERHWDPSATLLVGDNMGADVAAARGAGCAVALVKRRHYLEFPLTKIWRLVESIHRLRRRKEWRILRRLGATAERTTRGALWEGFAALVLLAYAAIFLLPLTKTPIPGSSLTMLSLELADNLSREWPTLASREPERSPLVLGGLAVQKNLGPSKRIIGIVSLGAAILAALLFYLFLRKKTSRLQAGLMASIVLFAPAFMATVGEISPGMVELLIVLGILLVPANPYLLAILFFAALTNGLSAICLIPTLLIRSSPRNRRAFLRNAAVAALIACSIWVPMASLRSVPAPAWEISNLEKESTAYAAVSSLSGAGFFKQALQIEADLAQGLWGNTGGRGTIPLLLLACLFSIPSLCSASLPAAVYLLLRLLLVLLVPMMFTRGLMIPLLLPFLLLGLAHALGCSRQRVVPLIFAAVLLFLILGNAPTVRRQIISSRQSYTTATMHASHELSSSPRTND